MKFSNGNGKAAYPFIPQQERGPNPAQMRGSEVGGGARTDPSVRLSDALSGEPLGCVDMKTTMGKPEAYQTNRHSYLGRN